MNTMQIDTTKSNEYIDKICSGEAKTMEELVEEETINKKAERKTYNKVVHRNFIRNISRRR